MSPATTAESASAAGSPSLRGGRAVLVGEDAFVTCRLVRGRFPEHSHKSIQVSVPFHPGRFRARWLAGATRRTARLAGERTICITPSYQPHEIDWEGDMPFVGFYLTPRFMAGATGAAGDPEGMEVEDRYGLRDPFIRQLALSLLTEFRAAPAPSRMLVESVATVLAAHVARRYSSARLPAPAHRGGLPPRLLRRVEDYIEDHLAERITLARLARTAGLSPFHFSRAFRRATGRTPFAALRERRIERAKRLLRGGGMPLAEVALACGFSSQSHFTTLFREATGLTPLAFRRGR